MHVAIVSVGEQRWVCWHVKLR